MAERTATGERAERAEIGVRPLAAGEEALAFARLAVEAFFHASDVETTARGWTSTMERAPGFDLRQRRGAFQGDEYLGGYSVEARTMRVGAARLPVGCVGSLVVRPEWRRRGVASALLADALAYARERGCALLLLNGIPNFYRRFGYTDVLDYTEHLMRRADVLAQPAGPYAVRRAGPADAATVAALYERHYGPFTGSFVHTPAWEEHFLALRGGGGTLLALDGAGQARGYLILWWGESARAMEVGADDWPAALALLRHQAEAMEAGEETLAWHLPPDAPTVALLADHLTAADTSDWGEPSREGSIRSVTYRHPDAGWMARVADAGTLVEGMLPAWSARLRAAACGWEGRFTLVVGEAAYPIEVSAGEARPQPGQPGMAAEGGATPAQIPCVRLAQETLAALIFGYRTVEWAAAQPGAEIAHELLPPLRALFPMGQAWIAGSDEF